MQKVMQGYERITISLPQGISKDIEEMKKELHVSKSELFKRAFEKFLQDYKKRKLKRAAELMAAEYEQDEELTAFTAIDSAEFK